MMSDEELILLRMKLKQGDYDGADVLYAWHAIDELLELRAMRRIEGLVLLRDVIDCLSRKDIGCMQGYNVLAPIEPAYIGSCMTCGRFYDDCVCGHNDLLNALMSLNQYR